jgi:tRNA-2-methylthio-N6-dimethylallyladenosine synthase
MKYFIWTEGCQMNASDSRRVAGALEALGCESAPSAETADVIVLNTCVVRQSAEDKAYGRLTSLRPLKVRRPELIINLMGCLVGRGSTEALRQRFPYVDVFSPPSDPRPLIEYLARGQTTSLPMDSLRAMCAGNWDRLPLLPVRAQSVTAFVPIVLGCSHACSFCVIPYRRGGEQSRSAEEILSEIRPLAAGGVREITLLGQIVDRYGLDRGGTDLSDLLRRIHAIDGLQRVRFLTSHPNWLSDSLLQTMAALPKVCEHIEVPVQSGDDEVLARMRRGYTADMYRRLIGRIREALPGASIGTDVIVGFPGESDVQFRRTYELLSELRLDVAHLARYSPRPGTRAMRELPDDVPPAEKMRRFRALEELQEAIAVEKNGALLATTQEVLVESRHKGRWMGRTRTNRLVFFDDSSREWAGQMAQVVIARASAWSLQGELAK